MGLKVAYMSDEAIEKDGQNGFAQPQEAAMPIGPN